MNRALRGYKAGLVLAFVATAVTGHAQYGNEQNPRLRQSEAGGPWIAVHDTNRVDDETNPPETGRNRTEGAPTAGGTSALSPIIAHGGPTLATPTVYLIWYGNWNQANGSDTPAGQQIVRDFLYGLNDSPYFQINTTYAGPSGFITTGGETSDTGSQGTRLSDSKIGSIVSRAISSGSLPKDSTGVYFVLTSSNVSESSGFCSRYCGWHTHGTLTGTDIKYAFIGNANRCLSSCAAQTVGPNGNAGVDGMVSVIAHELEEATTDPDLNAWYDSSGAENADKCAWTFGQNQTLLPNGAYANMSLPALSVGSRNYLIQRNLSASDNKCYVNWVTKGQ